MSSFTIPPSHARFFENPEKKKKYMQYSNEYNFFNKNIIKMNQIRKKNLQLKMQEKRETSKKLYLPKMLYSNFYLGNYSNSSSSNLKYEKEIIEHAAKLKKEPSHANKNLVIFEDLLNCVDSLDLHISENQNDKNLKENEAKNEQEAYNINVQAEPKENTLYINKAMNTETEIKYTNDKKKNPITFVTEISNDSIVSKIKKQKQNFKNNLHFNNYGKYKYTDEGVNYPGRYNRMGLPEYMGDDSREREYYNYRKMVNNPNKIYNSIGTFNEKFNRELRRISRTYGTDKSRGRFVTNPLLNSYKEQIQNYDLYKDMKFIENRYSDNKRYKFKLLPLVSPKLRNFDRLGDKIYQNSISKREENLDF